ncbi:MAG: lactonase family protein [Planctomycetota bacterium]
MYHATFRLAAAGALLGTLVHAAADSSTVWIGTTTPRGGASKGIYGAAFDSETGAISQPWLAAEMESPGFVALHPNGRWLYSTGRRPDGEGDVAAFEISGNGEEPAQLRFLNAQSTGDGGAAHLAVDKSGDWLFTAQYGGGSVALFPLDAEGRIGPRRQLVEHVGAGPDARRQQSPHPHWVGVSPDNRFLMVPDLGIDKVVVYRFDAESGRIEPTGAGVCPPGGGPRHMKFHPNGRFVYVVNELQMSVTVFSWDAESGTLTPVQTISTLPDALQEVPNTSSEIRVHPNGRFVYAANRGHDSIAAFRVDEENGRLTFVEREAIRGSWPRNFNIDPSGKWLVAAGRDSATLAVFGIDQDAGNLRYTGKTVGCPSPICVEFQPRR